MSNTVVQRACLAVVTLVSLALAILPGRGTAADYALIMPGAAQSLLLDIARAGDQLVAVGERGHILYSKDAGESWSQAQVPSSVMLTRVFFLDEEMGWAVGHDGNVLFSQDAGIHWLLQRDGVSEQARINEKRVDRDRTRVKALREQLAAARETGGATPQDLEDAEYELANALEIMAEPAYPPPLMDVWFDSAERGWAAGAFGTLLHTSNGGRHWEDWGYKVENPEELHFNGIANDSADTLYLASEWGYVFRSTTFGESWDALETGYDGSFFGVLVSPASDSVFAYGLRGTIFRSTDGGESWEELDTPTNSSLFGAAATAEGTLVFVGKDATVLVSTDDGGSFTPLPQQSRRGLYGVAPLGGARFAVTGEGGSSVLSAAAEIGRQPGNE